MKNDYISMRWLLLLAVVLLLNACSDTDAPGDQKEEERVQLELRPYVPSFLEVSPNQTRAFPGDYNFVSYANLYDNFKTQQSLVDATIHMLYTKANVNGVTPDPAYEEGTFYKSGDVWRSLVKMDQDQLYLYGFIPDDVANGGVNSVSPLDGDYANGITFTIHKMNSITPADVCVTVAAGRGSETSPDEGFGVGKFGFKAKTEPDKNFVYLLFDHIYSSICFSFKVKDTYNELRTIKLKKLRLLNSEKKQYVDAHITLTANTTSPLTSLSFSASKKTDDTEYMETAECLLFQANTDDELVTLDPKTASDFLGCFVQPDSYSNFILESTYDVYDKNVTTDAPDGNLVRKDCVAKNVIKVNASLTRGNMMRLSLLVNPTYLYMLSEPDLDNPTVTLE